MQLSLIIPCYNEAANLPLLIPRVERLVRAGSAEVVLVDNGSTDRSPEVLAELLPGKDGVRSVRVPVNRGYGYGILQGLEAATGDVLGWTHADLQTDPLDALRGLGIFESSAEPDLLFVKGRRYGRAVGDTAFTVGMSAFESVLLRGRFWDINAQPTLFPRTFFTQWREAPHDFSLDLYAYHRAITAGLRVERFPVAFPERAHGASHWNVDWRSKVKFIRRTVDFSLTLRRQLTDSR